MGTIFVAALVFLAINLDGCSIPAIFQTPCEQLIDESAVDDEQLILLFGGDSSQRQQALAKVGQRMPDQLDTFLPMLIECTEDPSARVRATAITHIARNLIWHRQSSKAGQDQKAIELAVKMSSDVDRWVVYNSVYFGLSTVVDKSPEVIDRLVSLIVERPQSDLQLIQGRLEWGLRGHANQASDLISQKIAKLDRSQIDKAIALAEINHRLTGGFPDHLDEFNDESQFVIFFHAAPPYFPKSEEEFADKFADVMQQGIADARTHVRIRKGDYQCSYLANGVGECAALVNSLERSREFFKISFVHLDKLESDERAQLLAEMVLPSEKSAEHFEIPFRSLFQQIESTYPNFQSKDINWKKVGDELIPRAKSVQTQAEFSVLCQELIAQLKDSHARMLDGSDRVTRLPKPEWSIGVNCLIDDLGQPVVYHVEKSSAAGRAGIKPGMTVIEVDGRNPIELIEEQMGEVARFSGYSSDRYLRYDVARSFLYRWNRCDTIQLTVRSVDGKQQQLELVSNMKRTYVPRLPVPIESISDSANVDWTRLDENTGYLFVRRMRSDLIEELEKAVRDLVGCSRLIIDVRGNSGGGFDAEKSFRNFDTELSGDSFTSFKGQIAVLIDSRTISAGEGWVSWFVANDRAKLFGSTTAGASSAKKTVDVLDGKFRAIFSRKPYKGFLDRAIEGRGIEPDFEIKYRAKDLANGVDSVLESAKSYLDGQRK